VHTNFVVRICTWIQGNLTDPTLKPANKMKQETYGSRFGVGHRISGPNGLVHAAKHLTCVRELQIFLNSAVPSD
jgi:hypothetical protein